jgi:hypothetical protein
MPYYSPHYAEHPGYGPENYGKVRRDYNGDEAYPNYPWPDNDEFYSLTLTV